ncbi:MAG: DNA gyrase inhibitor YacG [Epsilonproteobacteria bacterium]|nr:MAG: DNA gyrase inhibitor YacG [Campylobacterota bacterium]RLA66731.1 MAG: DNA gyrase inhibitor YacG [Campylobacterota bacterium]
MVKCPQCAKKFNYHESKWRPFCRERCRQVDLGHWINETYTIPSKEPVSESDKKDE